MVMLVDCSDDDEDEDKEEDDLGAELDDSEFEVACTTDC